MDEFWRTGTSAGYRDDGAPGLRPQYGPDYYGGFLLDPEGNSAEAVHHDLVRDRGLVDHLWIRVADVAAAKRFYVAVAPYAGFRLDDDTPERAQFVGGSGSFSLVSGTPSEHVYMSFAADDDGAIDAFHDALAAGRPRGRGVARGAGRRARPRLRGGGPRPGRQQRRARAARRRVAPPGRRRLRDRGAAAAIPRTGRVDFCLARSTPW